MSDPCTPLHAFSDGELPQDEARAFEAHLAGCPRCQAELLDLLQLRAAAASLARPAVPISPRRRLAPRVAAVLLPIAAVILLALLLRSPEGALPSYELRGPSGHVESLRGETSSAAERPPLYLADSMLEVELLPRTPVSSPPAAALFVAEPGGPLVHVAGVEARVTQQGAFSLRASGRTLFGERPGPKLLFAVVAPSRGSLQDLAGQDPGLLASRPELRILSARVEYRPTLDR